MDNYLFTLITEEIGLLPYYVKGVGGLEYQVHIQRPNGYPDYQWLHCVKGAGKLFIDDKEFILRKNCGFFMEPGIPHEYFAIEEPWTTHWVTFDGQGIPPLLNSLGFHKYEVFSFGEVRLLDSIVSDIYIDAQSKALQMGYKCSSKLYGLIMELKKHKMEAEEASGVSKIKKLEPVIAFLEQNYSKNPTIEDMGQIIDASPQYLCRLFNQTLRMRPFVYLTLLRLQKAKEMLIYRTDLPVRDIADQVGYNDSSYFSAIFKKYEGLTPMEFRKIHQINA
jgi:AraC-like DNA-binding protein